MFCEREWVRREWLTPNGWQPVEPHYPERKIYCDISRENPELELLTP